jgi:hypothetical protein
VCFGAGGGGIWVVGGMVLVYFSAKAHFVIGRLVLRRRHRRRWFDSRGMGENGGGDVDVLN